jgi:transposase
MSKKRRKFSSGFKAKVVLEALKERQTLQDLASKYELYGSKIVNWKQVFCCCNFMYCIHLCIFINLDIN